MPLMRRSPEEEELEVHIAFLYNASSWMSIPKYYAMRKMGIPFPSSEAKVTLKKLLAGLDVLEINTDTNFPYGESRKEYINEIKDSLKNSLKYIEEKKELPRDYPDIAWRAMIGSDSIGFGNFIKNKLNEGTITPEGIDKSLIQTLREAKENYENPQRNYVQHTPFEIAQLAYAVLFMLETNEQGVLERKSQSYMYLDGGIEEDIIGKYYEGWRRGFHIFTKKHRPIIEVMNEDTEKIRRKTGKLSPPCIVRCVYGCVKDAIK